MSEFFEDLVFDKSEVLFESNEFQSCIFKNCKFEGLSLRGAKLFDCKFINCNLSNTALTNSIWSNNEFTDCKLIGVNWSAVKKISEMTFSKCQLNYSSFQNLKSPYIKVLDSNCISVDFSDCDLNHCDFTGSDLTECFFSNCNLKYGKFVNVISHSIDLSLNSLKNACFDLQASTYLLEKYGIKVVYE